MGGTARQGSLEPCEIRDFSARMNGKENRDPGYKPLKKPPSEREKKSGTWKCGEDRRKSPGRAQTASEGMENKAQSSGTQKGPLRSPWQRSPVVAEGASSAQQSLQQRIAD